MRATASLLVLSVCLTGCGLLYHRTVVPATDDFHATPVMGKSPGSSNVKRIKYSWYVDVQWDSNGIGDIAKEHGISPVHYADLEELRILGIWLQTWLIVYGERTVNEEADPPSP